MSRHRKELRGALKAQDPRSWPIWPMRKSVNVMSPDSNKL